MTTNVHLLLVGIGICAAALAKAVLDRLCDRTAKWLLPGGQAMSFRIAWFILHLARWIAPTWYFVADWDDSLSHRLDWRGPDEALADLEEDRQDGRPILRPVRLVLPLLRESVVLRAANAYQRTKFWGQVMILLLPFTLALPRILVETLRRSLQRPK